MLEFVKESLKKLRQDEPGQRFLNYHLRRKEHESRPVVRTLLLALAVVLIVIGAFLSVLPGPAFVFYIAAAAILAGRFRSVAVFLDKTEVWLRKAWAWVRERFRKQGTP